MAYNRLLASLSPELYERLSPHMAEVDLPQGTVLHDAGNPIESLYFPTSCLLSITITMEDGKTAEAGVVGNREVLGINAFMGGKETTQTEYIVQIAGQAVKANASVFKEEFDQSKELRDVLLKATQAYIAQLSQTTACNRLHLLDQRLARWLLEAQKRVESNYLPLTQEFLAVMLGVRRAGVTQAAQKLQSQGLIEYNRGHIDILDQAGLEAAACECVRVINDEYDRLLGSKENREYIR
jgi:CRP-like cAMP-binding protein